MPELTLILVFSFMFYREWLHDAQITKMEELLKAHDLSDYYGSKNPKQEKQEQLFMEDSGESQNDLMREDPLDIDLLKSSKINVDGDVRDIQIY